MPGEQVEVCAAGCGGLNYPGLEGQLLLGRGQGGEQVKPEGLGGGEKRKLTRTGGRKTPGVIVRVCRVSGPLDEGLHAGKTAGSGLRAGHLIFRFQRSGDWGHHCLGWAQELVAEMD